MKIIYFLPIFFIGAILLSYFFALSSLKKEKGFGILARSFFGLFILSVLEFAIFLWGLGRGLW